MLDIASVIGAVDDVVSRNVSGAGCPCDLQCAVTDHLELQIERRGQLHYKEMWVQKNVLV